MARQITARVPDELEQRVLKYFVDTPGKFKDKSAAIRTLLETGLNPPPTEARPLPVNQHPDFIALQDKNELQRADISKLSNKITELQTQAKHQQTPVKIEENIKYIALKTEVENLKADLKTAQTHTPAGKQLTENQILVDLHPVINTMLIDMKRRENIRTGRQIEKQDILTRLFFAQVTEGPGDHLPIIYKRSEINSLLDQAKPKTETKP